MVVKNGVHDATLTALDKLVTRRVEMAARSITESSARKLSNVVQNPDQRHFTGNTEKTPLMSASGIFNKFKH